METTEITEARQNDGTTQIMNVKQNKNDTIVGSTTIARKTIA